MRKWLLVSTVISVLHFMEDFTLVAIGRYTTVNIWVVLSGVILFGILIGSLSRIKKIKRFLVD